MQKRGCCSGRPRVIRCRHWDVVVDILGWPDTDIGMLQWMSHGYRCRHWKPLPDFGPKGLLSQLWEHSPAPHFPPPRLMILLILQVNCVKEPGPWTVSRMDKICCVFTALNWNYQDLQTCSDHISSFLSISLHGLRKSDSLGYPFWQPGTQKHSHTPLVEILIFHIIKPSFQNLPCHDMSVGQTVLLWGLRPDSLPDTHGAGLGWAVLAMGMGKLQVHILTAQGYGDAHGSCDSCSSSQCDVTQPVVQVPLVCFPPPTKLHFWLFVYSTLCFSLACLFVSLKKRIKPF